jgi:hypothetical protein
LVARTLNPSTYVSPEIWTFGEQDIWEYGDAVMRVDDWSTTTVQHV